MPTRIKKVVSSLCSILAIVLAAMSSSYAASDGKDDKKGKSKKEELAITEVFVDFNTETISVAGSDFKSDMTITLGDASNIGDISMSCTVFPDSTPDIAICDFSSTGVPPDGDYRLQLSTGKGSKDNIGYDLTIGAVGPAGPQGVPGLQGIAGIQGETGPVGPQGVAGPQGDTGPIGPQGDAGPAGPQGATGAEGPAGATGAEGPAGATGAQGPRGFTGPRGSQGLPGVSQYQIVNGADTIIPTDVAFNVSAVCPANKRALGGGYRFRAPTGQGIFATQDVIVYENYPINARQWWVTVANRSAQNPVTVNAYVICGVVN